jgi:hypothetical protein
MSPSAIELPETVAMLLKRCLIVVVLACMMWVPVARAWGPQGHRVVAALAQRHLSRSAAGEVTRLLAPEHTGSLADIANWADSIRNQPTQAALWARTRRMHYVHLDDPQCRYVAARDCADGQCVVGALRHFVAVLADRGQPLAVRRQALKFVVHFAGDIHQPLHAGYRDDRGGNLYQVQFEGRGSNLHRVWDSGLLYTRGLDWTAYANELDARAVAHLPWSIPASDNSYVAWAQESCRITGEAGFYPAKRKISQAYVRAELPVAEQRLREAGWRLAEVLNTALAP